MQPNCNLHHLFQLFLHSLCLIHMLQSSRHRKQRGCDPGSFSCHTDRRKLNRPLKENIHRDTHESSRLTLNYLWLKCPVLTLQLFNSTCFFMCRLEGVLIMKKKVPESSFCCRISFQTKFALFQILFLFLLSDSKGGIRHFSRSAVYS